jgi:hypothetical protein
MGRPALVGVLSIGLVAALAVASAAAIASSHALDDGCLVTRDVRGTATINLRSGFVIGRFDQGQLWIDDRVENDGTVRVSGFDETPRELTGTKTRYAGYDMRFRASGRTVIVIKGIGVYVSVIGKGSATLSGVGYFQDPAAGFSVDADSFCTDKFQEMPDVTPQKFVIGGTA